MLPVIPNSSLSPLSLSNDIGQNQQTLLSSIQTIDNKNDMQDSIEIKDEKIEPIINLSSPIIKARKETLKTTIIAKPIDKRREEVNDGSMTCNQEIIVPSNGSSCLTQRKQSSSTTAIELLSDSDFHYRTSTNILSTEQDIVESKSFIHKLDFNIDTLNRNEYK